ncbi:MAG TPA: beta-N-acetylhexosaminidase, partial [Polyangiaceae bacterium]|nr:beta-N-acetylhexosaminidase [Polyangiaceae bacterium]
MAGSDPSTLRPFDPSTALRAQGSGLGVRAICGALIVGGFHGETLPEEMRQALQRGERGGVILFRRNIPSVEVALSLNREVLACCQSGAAPFIAVDEEGGRVQRLPAPALKLPPMQRIGHDLALVERVAQAVGTELKALGFNLNFAPVLDVDSNPANPIIGDRAFAKDPAAVIAGAAAYMKGLASTGVLSCVKHFPGHGDTNQDSHLTLPHVTHDRPRLDQIELAPFAALLPLAPTAMTAHVVYEALDPGVPASRSPKICTQLLRDQLKFNGVLFSDDLEMKALSAHASVEDNAIACIAAGCDALLICESWGLQQQALEGLVKE